MKIDLSGFSRPELLQLQKDVAVALEKAEVKALQEARAAAERAVAEFGYSLSELETMNSRKKTVGAAKYRNPANPDDTWTGRGRKPRWMIEAIEQGVDISTLEI